MRRQDKLSLLETENIYFELCMDTPHNNIAQKLGRGYMYADTGEKRYDINPISKRRSNFR